jgi:transcriptional regulator with XRE-family HTH domain
MSDDDLGPILKAARVALNLSLRDVERRTGIHNAHLSQIEKGTIKRPDMSMLFELAQVYGVEFGDLMAMAGYADEAPSSGRGRQRMTLALRALGDLSAKDQEEVLRYIAQLRERQSDD